MGNDMVLDYKGTHFSFDKKRRQKRLRGLRITALIITAIVVYFFVANLVDSHKIGKIQDFLLTAEFEKAAERIESVKGSIYHRKTKIELEALTLLYREENDRATEVLKKLGKKRSSFSSEIFIKFLNLFLDRAQYRQLEMYTDFLMPHHPEVSFFKALARTALFDAHQSSQMLGSIGEKQREIRVKSISIIEDINRKIESGKINYIFDFDNNPIAYYDLKKRITVSLIPGFDFALFNDQLEGGLKFFKLTVDLELHEALHELFRRRNGSFLMIDLNDSSIIAAYSKPVDKKNKNVAFSGFYEAGSIVKALTLYAYFKNVPEPTDLFPYFCRGYTVIENKIFYDWLQHRQIETAEDALVVSCNAIFSRMALLVGPEKLVETFRQFNFNMPDRKDLFMNFKTGRINSNIKSDLQLVRLAVGIGEVTVTSYHSALLAALIAQHGSVYSPYILKNIKNVLNLGYYNHQKEEIAVSKDYNIFETIKRAMVRVVEDEKGTGTRARVDSMSIAIKTGTAGEKRLGFDAIIMGFFPAHKPRYAFGFRLERGGKAQVQGAYFLKDFLTLFNRLKNTGGI